MDFGLIPTKKGFLQPIIETDVKGRKSRICEEGYVGESLIKPASKRSNDNNLFWIKLNGTVDGSSRSVSFLSRGYNSTLTLSSLNFCNIPFSVESMSPIMRSGLTPRVSA